MSDAFGLKDIRQGISFDPGEIWHHSMLHAYDRRHVLGRVSDHRSEDKAWDLLWYSVAASWYDLEKQT